MPLCVVQQQLEHFLKRRFGFGVHLIILSYFEEPFEGFEHLFNDAPEWNGFTWVHVRNPSNIKLFAKWDMV